MINKTDKECGNPLWASHSHFQPRLPQQQHESPPQSAQKQPKLRTRTDLCQDMHLANPEHQSCNFAENTLKKLIDMNQNYLIEKIKVSDVPTPAKYSHKMPSKTGQSEYFLKYGARGRSVPEKVVQPSRVDSLFNMPGSPITGYQSTYHMDFPKKAVPAEDKMDKRKSKYLKPNAPSFNETSYKHDFGCVAPSPTSSAKRVEVKLMGGGKLSQDTTYKQYYRMRTEGGKAPQPIIQKDNRIFMTLNQPQRSSYRDTFNENKKSKKEGVESCKPTAKYTPTAGKLKYKTEYSQTFIKPNISKKKEFECLSPEELKSYVMAILDD